ncbi:MAG: permease [Gammaproteobacteria bacterium]|nr:permease [Gammaproteobacteria bacterium]
MHQDTFKQAFLKSVKGFTLNLPMLMGVILLTGLFEVFITPDMLSSLFTGQVFYDTLIGTFSGAISAGQPFVSYLIGGELLDIGMSYYAVTAFVLSWVTLGVVQIPYEYSLFGGRFTLTRNLLAFIFVLLIAFATVQTLQLLS